LKHLILIVDDNVSYVERIVSILSEDFNAAHFHTAGSYDEATVLIDQLNPHVAMLDINLPGKSGIDILNYIKREKKDCRVIMITNHAFDSYRKKCLELGAEHFLDKSADFEKISSILGDMLNHSN
jgi:DNA-binding NarL/FixJ family response regulator